MQKEFKKFLNSQWGLEIRQSGKAVFHSKKSGVGGLLDFIEKEHASKHQNITIFDKIVGRGAALLAAYIKAKMVYGGMGSESAAKTLKEYVIQYYFQETCANIMNRDKSGICPIEKLSFKKTPEEFYKNLCG